MNKLVLAILLSFVALNAQASINQKYGDLGPRVSQAEFQLFQSETIDLLLPMIKRFEGFRAKASQDHDGTWTVCYGSTGKHIGKHSTCSRSQANTVLQVSVPEAIAEALALSPILKNSPQRLAAIADFIYNCGDGAYRLSNLRLQVNRGNWAASCTELKGWVHARGKKLRGLAKRRAAECALLG